MSKRQYQWTTTQFYLSDFPYNDNRQMAEKMCRKKLRKISKEKLYQTVLVRNTLKYVQKSKNVTFACDDGKLDDYEPQIKKHCWEESSYIDINEIFKDIPFLPGLLPPEEFCCGLEDSLDEQKVNTKNLSDSVVPDNEVLQCSSEGHDVNGLLINRTTCTVINHDKENNESPDECSKDMFNDECSEDIFSHEASITVNDISNRDTENIPFYMQHSIFNFIGDVE